MSKAVAIPRKKLNRGVGGMGRPASSAISKVRFEDEWVDWEWFLVLANVPFGFGFKILGVRTKMEEGDMLG